MVSHRDRKLKDSVSVNVNASVKVSAGVNIDVSVSVSVNVGIMVDDRGNLRSLRGLRVGGRFRLAALAWKQRHPIALPRQDSWAERLAWYGDERERVVAVVKRTLMDMEPLTLLDEKEPLEVGRSVLVLDDIQPRERWSLALVTAAPLSSDRLQLRVSFRLSNGQHLERDIRKVVLLERDGEKDGVEGRKRMAEVVTDIV